MYHRILEAFRRIHLRTMVIISVTVSVISVAVVFYIQSYSFFSSIKQNFAVSMEQKVRQSVFENLDSYLKIQESLNQLNTAIAGTGQLDLWDEQKLAEILLKEVAENSLVDSAYFANEVGGMVSVGQYQDQYTISWKQGMKDGELYVYSADRHGNLLHLIRTEPNYEPRLRPWYSEAKRLKDTFWTNVYVGNGVPALMISNSQPLLDEQGNVVGVFGTEILLERFSEYLRTLSISPNGKAYLVEPGGMLIASSSQEPNLLFQQEELVPIQAQYSSDPILSGSWNLIQERIQKEGAFQNSTQEYRLEEENYYLDISCYYYKDALRWYLIIAVPKGDYNQHNSMLFLKLTATVAAFLAMAFVLGVLMAKKILHPIRMLNRSVLEICSGKWGAQIPTNRSDELGELTCSFNQMSKTIEESYESLLCQKNELEYLNANLEEIVRRRTKELQILSITDELTGIYNHRYIVETLKNKMNGWKKDGEPLAIGIFDIDFFKQINDTYGHLEGNQILITLSQFLKKNIRYEDVVGRYGGEEFLLIMPNTTLEEAYQLADALREEASHLQMGQSQIRMTFSGGIAACESNNVDEIIRVADAKLYQAKAQGRNRIVS